MHNSPMEAHMCLANTPCQSLSIAHVPLYIPSRVATATCLMSIFWHVSLWEMAQKFTVQTDRGQKGQVKILKDCKDSDCIHSYADDCIV